MSARALIAGGDLLIGALTVTGRASQTVLFRAIRSRADPQGIAFALRDPTLEVYNVNGNLIASNDNWKSNQQTQIQATGLAPTDDREAAILLNLQPGIYFTVVRGAGGTIGIAQAEDVRITTVVRTTRSLGTIDRKLLLSIPLALAYGIVGNKQTSASMLPYTF